MWVRTENERFTPTWHEFLILQTFRFSSPAGPVKISDNNIENIINININIQGVFTNNIEQDIVSVVAGLLNQQGTAVGGTGETSLKDQLLALAKQSGENDFNVDVPGSSFGSGINFDGLADKIKEAIANKSSDTDKS